MGGKKSKKYLKDHIYINWVDAGRADIIGMHIRFNDQYVHFMNASDQEMILWLADPKFFEKAREIVTNEFVKRIAQKAGQFDY